MNKKPTIIYFCRDLRILDSPAFQKAAEYDAPIIPVFIYDPVLEGMLGAAPKWRLHQAIKKFSEQLDKQYGTRLILRRGDALGALKDLIEETGANTVIWSRQYDKQSIARNTQIKANLSDRGITVSSVNSSLLFEPWTIRTKSSGGPYKVYSPFQRSLDRESIAHPLGKPTAIPGPDQWPDSDALDNWKLEKEMDRGGAIVAQYASTGEEQARKRLDAFLKKAVITYKEDRNFFAQDNACSGLSQHLTWGEISPTQIWYAAQDRLQQLGDQAAKGGEHFLKEILWREFAYHLLYHFPDLPTKNFREDWDAFPWREDNADAEKWRQGRTGVPLVDAAMREMYATGIMHNRSRMMVASYLCKHLMTHWRVGEDWFRHCLLDWDIASNALGWQWTAGCGPDAAPYFRIFNAESQIEQYDPDQQYIKRYLAEPYKTPQQPALDFFDAIPKSWQLKPTALYVAPIVEHKAGRERALSAYAEVKAAKSE